MAYSLFIDSSDQLTLGLLDEKLEWVEFNRMDSRKSSGVFHGLVEELLSRHNLDLFKLDRVFYAAGPGSYTGIRLIEGFCQILRWRKIKTNSFYLFEVPSLFGMKSGTWISEAYKGELFLYSWNESETESRLIKKEEAGSVLKDKKNLVSLSSIDDYETKSVLDYLRDSSKDIFSKVLEKGIQREPFYYRTIENEFTKPKVVRGRL